MKTLYFDTFSGISGDMTIGALLDAGLSLAFLKRELKKLKLDSYSISVAKVKRQSITASSFKVKLTGKQKNRDYAEIKKMIKASALGEDVKKLSLKIFEKIASAEAKVHGTSVEKVHFHEVGAVDSIVDVVGSAIGFKKLGLKKFYSSHIPTGSGMVKTSHGMMPLPAPATLLILKGVPLKKDKTEMELVTPTGAAIVSAVSSGFGAMPSIEVCDVGYGAGSKGRSDGVPNLLRIVIGKTAERGKRLFVIEANIDDATPEELSHALATAMKAGALDAFVTPIIMKKGRAGFTFSILCEPDRCRFLRELILSETSTIGVRQYEVDRFELSRKVVKVKTIYGVVRAKEVATPSGDKRFKPEFDDVSRLAKKNSVPYRTVYDEALAEVEKR